MVRNLLDFLLVTATELLTIAGIPANQSGLGHPCPQAVLLYEPQKSTQHRAMFEFFQFSAPRSASV